MAVQGKIWANSADSHWVEPEDLWRSSLPPAMAERMPRSVKDDDGQHETVTVDGLQIRRKLPSPKRAEFFEASGRPPGHANVDIRLKDNDEEGIWAELVFPSLGMWNATFRDPALLKAAMRVSNDFAMSEIQSKTPRLQCTAQVSLLDVDDGIKEMEWAASVGFKSVFMTTKPHPQQKDYNYNDVWEPFWAAAEELGMVLAFHIGTDPFDFTSTEIGLQFRGPGGAVLNYTETTYSGQRVATKMVACGALDRHPDLKMLIAEGGSSWIPSLGDRMNEGYRQHAMMVSPTLRSTPKELLYNQVYTSFQHDETATGTMKQFGYDKICWGSDYPHLEGTYGHTQKTLHELFDDQPEAVTKRITVDAYCELFPEVPPPPVEV
jgi:predicted TIM-barrel fold metal-dependent hydrolase